MYIFGKTGNYKNIKKLRGCKMTFIGMISEHKSFENIKEILKKNSKKDINLIHVSKKSISNIKNIRFETIIIDSILSEFKEETLLIKNMCLHAKYIAINTDINVEIPEFIKESKAHVITYGLNQKATVTISSITESSILIYLQKSLKNIKGKTIEIGEKMVKVDEENKLKTYEVLIIYIIFLVESKPIMEQSQEKSNFFEKN